jgi:exodeoxyribonuclease V alpha subunit
MTRRVRRATDTSAQAGLALEATVQVQAIPEAAPRAPVIDSASAADPAAWLALGFAQRMVEWATACGASESSLPLLRDAATRLSLATATGHACLDLAVLEAAGASTAALRDALFASNVVARADVAATAPAPLVLDADNRLYLQRYFDYERRIARRLVRAPGRTLDRAAQARMREQLGRLFAANAQLRPDEPDWQKLAAALAVLDSVTVISGGPGTGKTTTVVNLLACLLALDPETRIAIAAPTGKAAARMQDAVRERASRLPPEMQQRLPQESFTIHRLLGVLPDGTFRHDEKNPLALDVLVVDEASMLDLALAAKLFDAVPESARIVLLGDKDQLAAVESGAVFSELSADPASSPARIAELAALCDIEPKRIVPPRSDVLTPLHDRVVWFTRNFRFAADSVIGQLASHVNAGDADAVIAGMQAGSDPALTWCDDNGAALAPESMARLRAGHAEYFAALEADASPRSALFGAFERFRILCAEREGMRGVREMNELIGDDCRRAVEARWPSPPRSPWYCGRPVLVLRNDYVLKLYNGDIGIALPDSEGNLKVYFRQTDGSLRDFAPMRLPEHETAFATTVHKAQGSEFDAVALVLPARASRVLTRELVYTAVTRARRHVTLVCGAEVLATAVRTRTVRHSGLIARLDEEARR